MTMHMNNAINTIICLLDSIWLQLLCPKKTTVWNEMKCNYLCNCVWSFVKLNSTASSELLSVWRNPVCSVPMINDLDWNFLEIISSTDIVLINFNFNLDFYLTKYANRCSNSHFFLSLLFRVSDLAFDKKNWANRIDIVCHHPLQYNISRS